MTRRRMINPSIWADPKFNAISIQARLLFIGMISNSDDAGYLRADARSLRKDVFGLNDLTVEQVGGWLEEVKSMPTVHFYEVEGEFYAHFLRWEKHQTLRDDRRVPSSHPLCPDCPQQGDSMVTTKRQPIAAEVKGSKGKLSKEYGQEDFDRFWISYPKKVAKSAAIQAWKRLAPDEKLVRQILKSLDFYRQSEDWTKQGGKYIPYPASWLNGRRFEDELSAPQESLQDRRMREEGAKVDAIFREREKKPGVPLPTSLQASKGRLLDKTKA